MGVLNGSQRMSLPIALLSSSNQTALPSVQVINHHSPVEYHIRRLMPTAASSSTRTASPKAMAKPDAHPAH
eukprot:2273858-Karenia_brevis.AAC.1